MLQPQITSANSVAHYTGMVATFDEYRRNRSGAGQEEKQAQKPSRLANFFKSLTRRSKDSTASGAAAKTA